MTEPPSFHLSRRVTPDALAAALAEYLGRPTGSVFAYDDARTMLDPLNLAGNGLSQRYLNSDIEVAIGFEEAGVTGPLAGWFTVRGVADSDQRALAKWLAGRLGQIILYRDPIPHPKDHPEFESAQVLVMPDGRAFYVWWVGFGTDGHDDHEVWLCDLQRELVRPLRRSDFARMLAGGTP